MLKITKTLKWIEYLEDFLITMRTATFWECFLHAYLSYSSNTFLKLKLPLSSFIGKKMYRYMLVCRFDWCEGEKKGGKETSCQLRPEKCRTYVVKPRFDA